MALLFAEDGVHVNLSDPSEQAMDAVTKKAEKSGYNGKVKKHKGRLYHNKNFSTLTADVTSDYDSLCKSLSTPRLLVFSLPHGVLLGGCF